MLSFICAYYSFVISCMILNIPILEHLLTNGYYNKYKPAAYYNTIYTIITILNHCELYVEI